MASKRYEPGIAGRDLRYEPRPHDPVLSPDQVSLDSSSPQALAQSVRDINVSTGLKHSAVVESLLSEFARALEAGCTRAAAILIWSAGISHLADLLWKGVGESERGWNQLVRKARKKDQKILPGIDLKKIPECDQGFDIHIWQKKYTEPQIIFLGFTKGTYSADALEQLYRDCFRPRCRAAHPSATITPIEDIARSFRLIRVYLLQS